jgi:Na+-driven multidrug efflux pump
MDGSQPLMSRYYGEGRLKDSTSSAKSMYIFSTILIMTGAAATLLLKYQVASFFGVSEAVTQIVAERLPLYIIAYILVCFSRTTITYLYATEKNKKAGILTYSEPLLYIALLMVLPRFFGLDGIWTTILTVWLSMALLAIAFLISNTPSRKMKKQKV